MKKANRNMPWSILLALSLAAQAFAQGYIGLPEAGALSQSAAGHTA
ncbi:hypothetical protein LNV09_09860 [Paucibacter sp. B2R-40]|nr:hypothetical protein [Paucibacter sp. B2R-40]MCV2354466.1 hypothetical protein [Paucibacter sp. B2R-40]